MVQRRYIVLAVMLTIFLGSAYAASALDDDFGTLRVREVSIQGPGYKIAGKIYIPASISDPTPAFALGHGVSNGKEVLSGVALELARNGYIALTVDLRGHGGTDAGIGIVDPTLGLNSAVTYLSTSPYVDPTRIGIIGHSMGAGSATAVASSDRDIAALVLIGGGVGSTSSPNMTTTQPSNLLVIVGRNDVLFNVTSLEFQLMPVFGSPYPVVPEIIYGEFGDRSARKLVVPEAVHLTEPADPATASEIVAWANSALYPMVSYPMPVRAQTYLLRDLLSAVSLLTLIGLIVPISQVLNGSLPGSLGEPPSVPRRFMRERTVLLGVGLLCLVLFLPAMLLGNIVGFPPLVFGSSLAWWLLVTGLCTLMVLLLLAQRQSGEVGIIRYLRDSFRVRDVGIAVLVFVSIYALTYLSYTLLLQKPSIIVPIFQPLVPARSVVFPLFLPFFAVYFLAEGLFLHVYRERQGAGSTAGNLTRTLTLRLAPYLLLLAAQYVPMFIANYRLLPGYAAFFVEFLLLIVPLLAASVFVSWALYRYTGRIWCGMALNTLLFAWASAGLFPFAGF